MSSLDTPELRKDLPQLLAEAQVKTVRLRAIHSADPLISRIAEEAAASGDAMMHEQQHATDISREDGGDVILGLLGVWLGEPGVVISSVEGVLAHDQAVRARQTSWISAFQRARAAQLMLPDAARDHGGPADSPGVLGVDFDESFAGWADYDAIGLENSTGRTLHNCTVLVEIHGKEEVRQNVHFVQEWKPGSWRFARYGSGLSVGDQIVGRQTAFSVQDVQVSFWAEEGRTEGVVYPYVGVERDRDIRRLIGQAVSVRGQFVRTPLLGAGPSLDLTLRGGAPSLPAHSITLVFHRGGDDERKSYTWDRPPWKRGERRRFDLDRSLGWDPVSVDVELRLPESDYVCRRSISLTAPPAAP